MRIKEVAQICNLTEKAIRLYEEKGLIKPDITEMNGRKFRNYDDETIRRLKTIAGLRRSFFTIEQIAAMQNTPAVIPAVFAEYREELHRKCGELEMLVQRADALVPERFSSAEALSHALTGDVDTAAAANTASSGLRLKSEADTESITETISVSDEKAPDSTNSAPISDAGSHVWEEDPEDLASCRRYIDEWGKKYDRALFWGKVLRRVILPLGFLILLALGLYYIPFTEDIYVMYQGYEITYAGDVWQKAAAVMKEHGETDPACADVLEFPCPVEKVGTVLRLTGTVYRYLFREDYFEGSIESDRYPLDDTALCMPHTLSADELRKQYNRFRMPLDGGVLSPLVRLIYPTARKPAKVCISFIPSDLSAAERKH
ncbi:MAG: MerR family transcriptional regulator [Eubacteriales bacterium]